MPGNDYQMAVIRFQGEGKGRSLDVSVNSSQLLQSKVLGKKKLARLFLAPLNDFLLLSGTECRMILYCPLTKLALSNI